MRKTKIGIFGGTFNPVHLGHVNIAKAFIEQFMLDILYVIPNNIPPIKESYGVSGEDRLNMLKLAFADIEKAIVNDTEIKRGGMSYTCETVAELKDMHPESELLLLIGDDWVDRFDKWKDWRYITDNVTPIVACRGNIDISEPLERLYRISGKRFLLLENERISASSTEFRGSNNSQLLPKAVYEYIEERGLYRK